MAESVDAPDLKSVERKVRGGSSPPTPIMKLILENFISDEKCEELISHYIWNSSFAFKHGDTYPLNTPLVFGVTDRIENIAKSLDPRAKLSLCQIVKWPIHSKMNQHLDPEGDLFAVIVYLNDNYIGGETCFEGDPVCKPETGKLIMFSNCEIPHSVNEVVEGTRYTLALWFVRD